MKTSIHKTLILFAAVLTCALGQAQNFGSIKGKVFTPEGEPAPLATVHVDHKGSTIHTTTDFDGRFTLKPLDPGTYTVIVGYVGAKPYEKAGVAIGADRITFLNDIQLETRNELKPFEVTASKWTSELIDPEQPQKLQMLRSEFKDNPLAKNPVALVTVVAPSVYQDPSTGNLHFKGSRSGAMAFYVDGVKLADGLRGVPPKSIQSMTVYTGGIPARYGDVTGGVVAIETRSYFDLYAEMNARRIARQQKKDDASTP